MTIAKGVYSTLGNQNGNDTNTVVSGNGTGINTTGHGALVHVQSWETGGNTASTPTDTYSNAWNEVGRITIGSALTAVVWLAVAAITGAGHTVSYNVGAARPFKFGGLFSVQGSFANLGSLNPTPNTATGNSTSCNAGTLTTTQPALIVQWGVNDNGQSMQDGGGGSWGPSDLDIGTGTGRVIASNVQSAGIAWSPIFPITGGAVNWATVAFALIETSGGGGGGPPASYNIDSDLYF